MFWQFIINVSKLYKGFLHKYSCFCMEVLVLRAYFTSSNFQEALQLIASQYV